MTDVASPDLFYRLSVALAIGFLLGIERGWRDREAGEGRRAAGVRTFSLLGLLGGVAGALSSATGPSFSPGPCWCQVRGSRSSCIAKAATRMI